MNFYEAMQLGAVNLKPLIKETKDDKLKKKYIGITIIILIGELVHLPRGIGARFAFMSVIQPDEKKMQEWFKKRYPFTIIDFLIFGAIYLLIPEEYMVRFIIRYLIK